jgi:hypothetical protein
VGIGIWDAFRGFSLDPVFDDSKLRTSECSIGFDEAIFDNISFCLCCGSPRI